MKKSNIYTLVMLAFMTFGFALTAKAQFSSSDKVYCYQYVKTVEDGVVSKKDWQYEIVFINFYKEWAGYDNNRSASEVGMKLMSEPDYFNNKAIERAHNSRLDNPNEWWGKDYYRYDNSLSTSSKLTYRGWFTGGHYVTSDLGSSSKSAGWQPWCMAFSLDKSEMIQWDFRYPNELHYYKLIDPNTLKPNLDFLD